MALLPVIGAAVLSLSPAAHHEHHAHHAYVAHRAHGLPLMRGVYVAVDAPCHEPAGAARSWYSGTGYVIQAPHAHCEATRIRRTGRSSFVVKEVCRDDSMPQSRYRITERIHVIDPRQYVVHNNFGRFHARWCRE